MIDYEATFINNKTGLRITALQSDKFIQISIYRIGNECLLSDSIVLETSKRDLPALIKALEKSIGKE